MERSGSNSPENPNEKKILQYHGEAPITVVPGSGSDSLSHLSLQKESANADLWVPVQKMKQDWHG
jgi:hypothetical protein